MSDKVNLLFCLHSQRGNWNWPTYLFLNVWFSLWPDHLSLASLKVGQALSQFLDILSLVPVGRHYTFATLCLCIFQSVIHQDKKRRFNNRSTIHATRGFVSKYNKGHSGSRFRKLDVVFQNKWNPTRKLVFPKISQISLAGVHSGLMTDDRFIWLEGRPQIPTNCS